MSVQGVMVSYNYSEDEETANILTVSASGMKFSNRWVLTHGSILSPLKQAKAIQTSKGKPILNDAFYDNLPEIYVTCEKEYGNDIYNKMEEYSRDRNMTGDMDHNSYQTRVFTGRICHVWQCPILARCVDDILYSWTIGHRDADVDKQTQLGKILLSVMVLIDLETDDVGFRMLRPLSELLDLVHAPPERGSAIEVHSTPFGCEVFLNAVSRGTVCGIVGKRPTLLLTDAATSLGSEGGPVFSQGADGSRQVVGIVACSVSWWRGEWVGLSLVAPLRSVLGAKLRVPLASPPRQPLPHPAQALLHAIDTSTALVRCGSAWGAGVRLSRGIVLTCAHVVARHTTNKVSIYCRGVRQTAIVRYKSRDDMAYDLALLYTNQEDWDEFTPVEFAEEPAVKGESVIAAGYPYFNENNLEDLRPNVTSGHVNNVSPSMIQTSCCVQSGFSGGPIFRIAPNNTLRLLGIIVSNAKTQTGACFPYVNMAVPIAATGDVLREFLKEKDVSKLSSLEINNEMIQSQWRLLPYRSKI